MKKILVLILIGILTPAVPTLAYTNLSTTGGSSTGGGSTPSLQAVTDVGSQTTRNITLQSGADLLFDSNAVSDIGSAALSAGNIYASGTVYASGVKAIVSNTPSAPAYAFSGTAASQATGMYEPTDGTLAFTANGGIHAWFNQSQVVLYKNTIPTSNAAQSLGIFGQAWNGVFASGTSMFTAVTTTRLTVSQLTAAATGLNPICVDASGNAFVGSSSICPLSALSSKTDPRPISYGLPEVLKMEFKDFELNPDDGRTHSGPVADWVKDIVPNLILWRDGKINGFDYLSFTGVLGKAIQDLYVQLSGLGSRINNLERENNDLRLRIDRLEMKFLK